MRGRFHVKWVLLDGMPDIRKRDSHWNHLNMRCKILFILCLLTLQAQSQKKILIAAASDLKFALDSVVTAYKTSNVGDIEVTYGSSGKLSQQIMNGAPFDIFFSADISYPDQLVKDGKTSSEIYRYAKGRVVIWSKKLDPNKDGMKSLLHPLVKKIAIANPAHAPYGKRAVEALQHYKLFESLKPELVYGENISQTAQFISTGAADIGIIALSLAVSPNMKSENGKYFIIPEESHQPLVQGAVITSSGKDNKVAQSFFSFLKSKQATSILESFGFSQP
jgi:molybdate transport system substrate-binding protein